MSRIMERLLCVFIGFLSQLFAAAVWGIIRNFGYEILLVVKIGFISDLASFTILGRRKGGYSYK